ncbi:TRAP transporter substrate-binding protein DctP [Marinomonas sp. NPDC078689]|jgi:C4-dicarboxylate-binding protein DctP|uniref:TRAP transporter substrate-binding protein DctP n=1 Tax=Marinomonas sp. NPDC078689 TaxID=3364147 RepID=UPI0037C83623
MNYKTLLTAGLLTSALTFSLSAAAETTLRISLQLPLTHHLGKNLMDFKKEVEAKSQGDIKVKIFPSAQLFKDSEVHQAVSSGAIEMGVISLSQLAGTIPAVDIFYVPFMFPSQDKVEEATQPDSPVRSLLDDAILKTGVRPLWWQAYGGVALLSKKKAIKHPADMEGMKVRVFGKTLGEFVTAVGGAPTSMSGSEQFLAYQRGTVDAGMTGVSAVGPRKLYQVMDYLTLTNHADIEFMTIINEKTWESLSAGDQKIISSAARDVEVQLRNKIKKIESDAVADAEKHMTVIRLDDNDIAQWKEATTSVQETYLKNSGPLGAKVLQAAENL